MDDDASFGHWLRLRRKALRLSAVELARRIGCATVTLHKIEADERRPSEQIAARLAEYLNIASHQRLTFIKVARGELGVHRLAFFDQIADRRARAASTSLRAPLPIPPTALIGRAHEVDAVRGYLMRADVRLITLIGAPGIGKTRLALQVATELYDTFADGVYFIALAPIRDPELVIPTIAQALEISEVAGQPLLERVQTYLHNRQMLLILDNLEQVLQAALRLGELLVVAPHLTLVVTSRVALRLAGEHRFTVPPLALPPSTIPEAGGGPGSNWEDLTHYAAVELFLQRARAMLPTFELNDANAWAVGEICRRLDGLPLAIELAAARIELFTPQELLTRLNQRLTLLTTGTVDLPTRQQTLRRAIAWSYDLLDEQEQRLFQRLSVFVGGCTLEAAARVCNPVGDLGMEVLDGVAALMDKSLLQREQPVDGESRFTMLETIREYALERLAEEGETDTIRWRHAQFFLRFAEMIEPQLYGTTQGAGLACLEIEYDDLRAALAWTQAADAAQTLARMAVALGRFWFVRGYFSEGRRWLEDELLRRDEVEPEVIAKALHWAGEFASSQSDFRGAHTLLGESMALFRKGDDKRGLAKVLRQFAWLTCDQGDYQAAQASIAESIALFRSVSDHWGLAYALFTAAYIADVQGDMVTAGKRAEESIACYRAAGDTVNHAEALLILGNVAYRRGDYASAQAYYRETLALARKMGHKIAISWSLRSLGAEALARCDYKAAKRFFVESLILQRDLRHKMDTAICLEGLAAVAVGEGTPGDGARLLGAASITRAAGSAPLAPAELAGYTHTLAGVRAQLDAAAFAASWAAGQALTLDQAIAEALAMGNV